MWPQRWACFALPTLRLIRIFQIWSPSARLDLRIGEPHLAALLEGHDLLERFGEIELEIVPFGPAQMGRAQHVGHGEEGVVAVGDRLLLVDIDRRMAGPPLPQRGEQGAGDRAPTFWRSIVRISCPCCAPRGPPYKGSDSEAGAGGYFTDLYDSFARISGRS